MQAEQFINTHCRGPTRDTNCSSHERYKIRLMIDGHIVVAKLAKNVMNHMASHNGYCLYWNKNNKLSKYDCAFARHCRTSCPLKHELFTIDKDEFYKEVKRVAEITRVVDTLLDDYITAEPDYLEKIVFS